MSTMGHRWQSLRFMGKPSRRSGCNGHTMMLASAFASSIYRGDVYHDELTGFHLWIAWPAWPPSPSRSFAGLLPFATRQAKPRPARVARHNTRPCRRRALSHISAFLSLLLVVTSSMHLEYGRGINPNCNNKLSCMWCAFATLWMKDYIRRAYEMV
jgi:hypothetical protein